MHHAQRSPSYVARAGGTIANWMPADPRERAHGLTTGTALSPLARKTEMMKTALINLVRGAARPGLRFR